MGKKEKEMIEKAYKQGFEGERNYRGCAQCAIAGIQDALNIKNDLVYKAGSGLAGGAGECIDGLCGGYSGGIMMMSTFFGRTRDEEATTKGREDKYVSFGMATELHDIFIKKYGSVICKDIQKRSLGGPLTLGMTKKKSFLGKQGLMKMMINVVQLLVMGQAGPQRSFLRKLEKEA